MANPFDFTQHMQRGPSTMGGGGGGGGRNRNKNRNKNKNKNRDRPGGGGGGRGNTPDPSTDDNFTDSFWMEKPREAYTQFFTDQGFDMGGSDALANWMNNQFDTLHTAWQGNILNPAYREQTFQDYLTNLGRSNDKAGPQPLQPLLGPSSDKSLPKGLAGLLGGPPPAGGGTSSTSREEMLRRYQLSSLESKGLNYAPYEGFSRWLAF